MDTTDTDWYGIAANNDGDEAIEYEETEQTNSWIYSHSKALSWLSCGQMLTDQTFQVIKYFNPFQF